ncbi:MAG: pathogenesis-related protein 1 [Motiliproteus sp.]|jgi:pathogenesis-related protein 1
MRFKSVLPVLAITLSVCTWDMSQAFAATPQAEMLAAHNRYRALVAVPALTASSALAATAQAYADTLKTTQGCTSTHSHAAGLGENLFWASALVYSNGTRKPQDVTPTQVADAWGSEKDHYSYASNSCAAGEICGHYTQVVWNTSTQVGCGHATCDDHSQVWVCNYSPAGNWVGKKPY